ncbi:hypothetical protein LSH36_1103g00011 [Paralvinella palmiformis]|uniref:Toll-like receptor 3 n=1 Tax=Paralvinella palmiformis TaxID=53620 RepID=A0AAD9IVM9_9ANNE|nr:hypothetical protein LSH36_1103g00011 [Paralvinella palmiformis]
MSVQVRLLFVVLYLILSSDSRRSNSSINCHIGNDPHISWGRQIDCSRLSIANIPTGLPTVNVTSLLLDHNNIELVKYDDFKNFTDLRYLDLKNNRIGDIDDHAFDGIPQLIYLNLNFNYLSKWPNNAVSRLIRLKELYLKYAIGEGCTLGPLPAGFGYLTKLEKLVISKLHFGVISEGFFSKAAVSSVTFLDLSYSKMAGVERGAFRNFTNIRTLKLNVVIGLDSASLGNILSDLDNTNLTYLSLFSIGNITKLDEGLFSNFEHNVLKTLVLSYSNVTTINPGAFRNLANLRELYLQSINLREIKANSFNGLKSLIYLDISQTNIIGYNFSGSGLKNLKVLNMSRSSQLRHMKSYGFDGLGSLNELKLEYMKITILEACAFCGLPNLKRLSMAYSNAESVNPNTFAGLISLELLNLASAGIGYLNQSLFNNMTSLKKLILDYNRFSDSRSVSADAFRILPNLTYLSMESCQLSSDCGLFRRLPKLHYLSLMWNIGITLSEHAFLGSSYLKQLVLSNINTTIVLPSALNDLRLDYLDISFDGIAYMSPINVSYLYKLQTFAGERNPYSCSCENLKFWIWFNKTKTIVDSRESYYCPDEPFVPFDVGKCVNTLAFSFSVTTILIIIVTLGIFLAYLNRWHFNQIWYKFRLNHYKKLENEQEHKFRSQAKYDAFISCSR